MQGVWNGTVTEGGGGDSEIMTAGAGGTGVAGQRQGPIYVQAEGGNRAVAATRGSRLAPSK